LSGPRGGPVDELVRDWVAERLRGAERLRDNTR
jgi:hypothetical protein